MVQFKRALPKRARNRVKDVCRELLRGVEVELSRLDDCRSRERTRAQADTLIHDFLFDEEKGLPEEFDPEEIENLADVVFVHVYAQYRSAENNVYGSAA